MYGAEANAIAAMLRGGRADKVRRAAVSPTDKNLEVLAYMREFYLENDQLPPVSRIASYFSMNVAGADWHVQMLLRFGEVERNSVGKLRFARKESMQNDSCQSLTDKR